MREVVIQKVLSGVLVALALMTLDAREIAVCFAVLGQGHFLGAYYYQWKAGKMRGTWVLVYALLAASLIAIGLLTKVEWFMLAAGILFFIHHFQDEVTLFGKTRSIPRTLEQLGPIFLYSALMSDALFATSLVLPVLALVAVLVLVSIALFLVKKYTPDALSAYLLTLTLGLAAIGYSDVQIAPEKLFGSVVLFHYACWYIYFYFRFANNAERQRAYIIDMLAIHGIVFVSYALYLYTYWGNSTLTVVFAPVFFYIWAILHILFSIRLGDYRDALRW